MCRSLLFAHQRGDDAGNDQGGSGEFALGEVFAGEGGSQEKGEDGVDIGVAGDV